MEAAIGVSVGVVALLGWAIWWASRTNLGDAANAPDPDLVPPTLLAELGLQQDASGALEYRGGDDAVEITLEAEYSSSSNVDAGSFTDWKSCVLTAHWSARDPEVDAARARLRRADPRLVAQELPTGLLGASIDSLGRLDLEQLRGLDQGEKVGVQFTEGRLRITQLKVWPPPPAFLRKMMALVRSAAGVRTPAQLIAKLRVVVAEDGSPHRRLAALGGLTCLGAWRDADDALLLSLLASVGYVDAVRVAVRSLAAAPEQAAAVGLLGRVIDAGPSAAGVAAIEALCRLAPADLTPRLLAYGADSADAEGWRELAVAGALSDLADPAAEPLLLRYLARADNPELQAQAVRGLAQLGSHAALGPLYEAGRDVSELSEAVKQARAQILARHGDLAGGGLTVVGGHDIEGALSQVVDEQDA